MIIIICCYLERASEKKKKNFEAPPFKSAVLKTFEIKKTPRTLFRWNTVFGIHNISRSKGIPEHIKAR